MDSIFDFVDLDFLFGGWKAFCGLEKARQLYAHGCFFLNHVCWLSIFSDPV